jgi:hypothetical protein
MEERNKRKGRDTKHVTVPGLEGSTDSPDGPDADQQPKPR